MSLCYVRSDSSEFTTPSRPIESEDNSSSAREQILLRLARHDQITARRAISAVLSKLVDAFQRVYHQNFAAIHNQLLNALQATSTIPQSQQSQPPHAMPTSMKEITDGTARNDLESLQNQIMFERQLQQERELREIKADVNALKLQGAETQKALQSILEAVSMLSKRLSCPMSDAAGSAQHS